MCSKNSRGRGRSLVSMEFSDFFSLIAQAWDASSIYLTVQEVALEFIIGEGFAKGLGIDGLSRAPLNFTIKTKQPRKTPCGDDPGSDLGEEVAPLYLMTMLLSVR